MKRVIVAAGDQIAMKPSLMESLEAIFGVEGPPAQPAPVPPIPSEPGPEPGEPTTTADIANLISQAQQHYEQAQENLKAGDWAGYGREIDALQAVLDKLTELTSE